MFLLSYFLLTYVTTYLGYLHTAVVLLCKFDFNVPQTVNELTYLIWCKNWN